MQYEFHPEAELEFIEEAAFYESEVPGLGERIAREVERIPGGHLKFPHLWPGQTPPVDGDGTMCVYAL